jgi:NAD(P)H dehydrogenase (quinone)
MRILVLHAHPEPTSYNAALKDRVVATLKAGGHEVDLCDLYEERFDPVLDRAERGIYHDVPENNTRVQAYVDRLMAAEGLVLVFPVWNFGFPAILKGYFDRVFLPGVSFRLEDGRVQPNLQHLRLLATVTTYGAHRWRALVMGDPPRKICTRMLRVLVAPQARHLYLAHYDMNRSTPDSRERFMGRVEREVARLAR